MIFNFFSFRIDLRLTYFYFLVPKTLLTALMTSCFCGSAAISKDFVYGIGMSTPVTRHTGASKWKNVSCSIILAQISDPIP
jgi:hypothetical protein